VVVIRGQVLCALMKVGQQRQARGDSTVFGANGVREYWAASPKLSVLSTTVWERIQRRATLHVPLKHRQGGAVLFKLYSDCKREHY